MRKGQTSLNVVQLMEWILGAGASEILNLEGLGALGGSDVGRFRSSKPNLRRGTGGKHKRDLLSSPPAVSAGRTHTNPSVNKRYPTGLRQG